MYQEQIRSPPNEVLDGLFAACIVVGLIAGIIFGFRLYNSIISS